MKFKLDDILVMIDDPQRRIQIVGYDETKYYITVVAWTSPSVPVGFQTSMHFDHAESDYRKLTKLERALK